MKKKQYIKTKIKAYKVSPQCLCAGSPETGQTSMDKDQQTPGQESKSFHGIDWDLYSDDEE